MTAEHPRDVRRRRDLQPRVALESAERRRRRRRACHVRRASRGPTPPRRVILGVRERLDHDRQPWRASCRTASAHGCSVGAVPASSSAMRSSTLPPSRFARRSGVGVVRRDPVVELPRAPLQPAAVHRAERQLGVERAEQRQLLDDVGAAEHPVDAGWSRATSRPSSSERRSAMANGSAPTPSIPRAVWSAATMNSRPSTVRRAAGGARGERSGDRSRLVARARAARPNGSSSAASDAPQHSSISSASACRRRTSAARRRSPRRRCRTRRIAQRSQPDSSPWHSAPPKASPAPSPHTTSTRMRRHAPSDRRRGHQHAVAAELDDRRSAPRASSRSAASSGSACRRRSRTRRGCRPRPCTFDGAAMQLAVALGRPPTAAGASRGRRPSRRRRPGASSACTVDRLGSAESAPADTHRIGTSRTLRRRRRRARCSGRAPSGSR